jgi:predicted Rossmann fold flavoprotein
MSPDRSVIVVGAGAAGLTAALRAAEAGACVTLLNAHPQIGLKILMSGGTRCNVTHREVTAKDFNGGSQPFVARILRAFPPVATREWMESLGVSLVLEDTGKYFPTTDDAHTVLDGLMSAVHRAGVTIVPGARVVWMEPKEGGWRLGVQRVKDSSAFSAEVAAYGKTTGKAPRPESNDWREADAVVLATGGLSFPRTGSDGTGYVLAASLGHTIVPPTPALTPLTSSDPLCKELQGVTLDAELTLWVGGKRDTTIAGSLLFAHFGYSGPVALDLSRHWLRAEGRGERKVTANFLPGTNTERSLAAWLDVAAKMPKETVRRWLGERMPESLILALCREADLTANMRLSQIDRAHRQAMIESVTARVLPVTGTLGYEKAEVTAGGVELSEVNPSTLESRKAPGVFLCGEILDVEGRLGGFNFQWSWSSGTVAGRAAGRRAPAL